MVPSHHIRAYLWCHNIPNHCDVIGSSVTSSCPLFAAGIVMTPLLTSLTTTKCLWQQMADPCIVEICMAISHCTISLYYLAKPWDNTTYLEGSAQVPEDTNDTNLNVHHIVNEGVEHSYYKLSYYMKHSTISHLIEIELPIHLATLRELRV